MSSRSGYIYQTGTLAPKFRMRVNKNDEMCLKIFKWRFFFFCRRTRGQENRGQNAEEMHFEELLNIQSLNWNPDGNMSWM